MDEQTEQKTSELLNIIKDDLASENDFSGMAIAASALLLVIRKEVATPNADLKAACDTLEAAFNTLSTNAKARSDADQAQKAI